jgi:integrase
MEKKYEKQIKLCEQSIRSEYTKKVYLTCLRKYFEFPASSKNKIFDETDSRKVEDNIIDFIISLKKQSKGFAAIHNYVCAICKYYRIMRVILDTKGISEYLPEFRKSKKDRGYSHEEIQRLLDVADERMRTVILLLASTGMRVGAIPGLRLSNLDKIRIDRNLSIYKFTVYEEFNEEYVTFCTPECARAIDEYLNMRSHYGEKLTSESFLFREQFDVRYPFAISKCRQVRANTISKKLIDLAERSLIREKEVLVEGGDKKRSEIRKDVPIAHGFRKFFTTQLMEADLKTELRWLLEGYNLKGNDSHYIRTSDKKLLQEYEKALDNLTVDPANRLQRKVQKLEIEKSQLEKLTADVALLKRRLRN